MMEDDGKMIEDDGRGEKREKRGGTSEKSREEKKFLSASFGERRILTNSTERMLR